MCIRDRLQVHAPTAAPLRVQGGLQLTSAGFETADASIVGEQLSGTLQLDYRSAPTHSLSLIHICPIFFP